MPQNDDIFNALIDDRPRKPPPPKVKAAMEEYLPLFSDDMLNEIEMQIDARLCMHESKIPAALASDEGKTLLKMIAAQLRAMSQERDELIRSMEMSIIHAIQGRRIELSYYKSLCRRLIGDDDAANLSEAIAKYVSR